MTPYRTVIFDLDGTLIHSAPDLQAAANAALAGLGRNTLDLETVISFIGNGVEVLVERSLRATGDTSSAIQAEALALFHAHYDQNTATLTRPYPGVKECLARLKRAGKTLGICTNKPTPFAKTICDALDLSPFFEVIIGAEPDVAKKPDPAPLQATIGALKSSITDCLYVGDSSVDYRTARNAGVAFRLFTGGYLHGDLPEVSKPDRFCTWAASGLV